MRAPLIALIATTLLGGCAASIPPVQVTRFHLGAAIVPGTIVIAPVPRSLETGTYDAAVMRELARLGFVQNAGPARYMVAVNIDRSTRDSVRRRSPISIGLGGGTGGYGGGVGGGISFGLGGNRSGQIVATRLSVRIVEREGGAAVWEGRAETEAPANAAAGQPGLAADKLARALFRDFPGESGRTISVP